MNKNLLPKFIKEIVQHIPTLALKSMDWKSVFKEMGPLILKLGAKNLDPEKLATLKQINLEAVDFKKDLKSNISRLSPQEQKDFGQKILEIYFAQLKSQSGLNLDLRAKHFRFEDDKLFWAPNNLWLSFDSAFRLSLVNLYKGFYYENESLFSQSLAEIGLTKNLNQEQSKVLIGLFHNHFGPGDQTCVKFKIEQFQESFYELFKFFMDNEVELSKDFIFLGIYLVTLYLNLEQLDCEFDVRAAFLNVFPSEL